MNHPSSSGGKKRAAHGKTRVRQKVRRHHSSGNHCHHLRGAGKEIKLSAATVRKDLFLLSGVLLGVFLTSGCGLFGKSESGKEFEAWKAEAETISQPDPARRQQMRTELDKLRNSASESQAKTQDETIARHGPPTKTELDALREKNPTQWRTTPFGTMDFYLRGIPMYLFYNPPVGP